MTDLRGDVIELLDEDGERFASYRYNVWGMHSSGLKSTATSAISATLAAHIVTRQELRYAGYAYDTAHDLYYCSARYYDPVSRAFISRDPLEFDGPESNYQYCGGNPVLANDPAGERIDSGDGYSARRNSKGKWVVWDVWGKARRDAYRSAWRPYLNGAYVSGTIGYLKALSSPSLLGSNGITKVSAQGGSGTAMAMGGGEGGFDRSFHGWQANDPQAHDAGVGASLGMAAWGGVVGTGVAAGWGGLAWLPAVASGDGVVARWLGQSGAPQVSRLSDAGTLVVRNPVSKHAAEQMSARGVSRPAVQRAIDLGTRYYDRKEATIAHVVEGGMASGKTLYVATNPFTQRVVTVIVRSRFNESAVWQGAQRWTPLQ